MARGKKSGKGEGGKSLSASYKCGVCGAVFCEARSLSNHRRSHENNVQQPYACYLAACPQRYAKMTGLRRHSQKANHHIHGCLDCLHRDGLTHAVRYFSKKALNRHQREDGHEGKYTMTSETKYRLEGERGAGGGKKNASLLKKAAMAEEMEVERVEACPPLRKRKRTYVPMAALPAAVSKVQGIAVSESVCTAVSMEALSREMNEPPKKRRSFRSPEERRWWSGRLPPLVSLQGLDSEGDDEEEKGREEEEEGGVVENEEPRREGGTLELSPRSMGWVSEFSQIMLQFGQAMQAAAAKMAEEEAKAEAEAKAELEV